MTEESKPTPTGPASVQEIWEKTIVRFQQRTGQRLDGLSRSPDDLRRALDAHYAAQADDPDMSKAKAIGFRMIHCIQLLGGIAAQGASMVFGPAGLCFNALSFLLDIPKKVSEFHGEINAIFAEVGPALAQFRIYQRMEENTHVDDALRSSIDQVMTSFVDICANCINIHREGRWKSFKRNAKRVLLDEGSVRGELDNFKKLTQDQMNVQATLTLEVALETNVGVAFIKASVSEIDSATKVIKTDVTGLVEAEHKRGLNDARKKNLDLIREKLGQKEEDVANVVDARDNMWKTSVKGSGKWLNDLDEYTQWLDRSSSADPLLILTGEPGTGKSFLVSAIAQDVKARNSATKAERGLLGYYSFSIATKTDSDRNRPETAIKSICMQMADQDAVYAKHVAGVCGESGKDKNYFKDASCQVLWSTLGIGAPAKNAMHYILLDSVGLLSAEELERLLEAIQQRPDASDEEKSNPVRVLISGEPTNFEEWLSSVSAKSIDIAQHNAEDISAFVVEELKKADLFQGTDQDSQRRRKTVKERLIKRSNNCYATVQQDLGKIKAIVASSGTEDELNRVLQESSTDPKALVRSELETLEAVLNPRELDEVHELLLWTVAGFGRFNLDELAAALYLRFKSVSLQPLAQKITGKYSKIFTLTYGGKFIALRDHVDECVVAERVRPRQSADDPKITATISITNGDIKSVQRFFWDLTHHSSFTNGFQFQPDSDLSQAASRKIQIYRVDAHFEIVQKAFDYFLMPDSDDKQKGELSGKYLMVCLPDHLKVLYEAEGLDELSLADKQYIGSHVYDMFNEEDVIENNWESCAWAIWYKSEDEMGIFWNWLDDPVAIARLGARDKRWLADIKKGKSRNRSLLTPIMTMVARKWLQEDEWEVSRPSDWITGLLHLGAPQAKEKADGDEEAEPETDAQPAQEPEDDGEIYITEDNSVVEKVAKAEKWAKQALGVFDVDCTWCVRLGQTYGGLGESEAAVEQYKKAAAILQAQDPIDKDRLAGVFHALGDLQDEPKDALPYYKQAYEQNDSNVDILYALATLSASKGVTEEAASIVQNAATKTVEGSDSSLLLSMLRKSVHRQGMAWDEMLAIFRVVLSLMESSPEIWPALHTELEKAIDKARTDNELTELAAYHLLSGAALYNLRQESPEDLEKAATHWRAGLATVREEVGFEEDDQLVYIEQHCLSSLGRLCVEKTLQERNPDPQSSFQELQQAQESDRASRAVTALLASMYTLTGQREKARDVLRVDMVTAFNILVDDEDGNDWEGFASIRHQLVHTGDFENARRTNMLFPGQWFNVDIFKALLEGEESCLETASGQLVEFFEKECQSDESNQDRFNKVSTEVERLLAAAEPDSSEATAWTRISKILSGYNHFHDNSIFCNWCKETWNFEKGFNACKYCYDMDLCDKCLGDLRAGTPGAPYICSKLHDWIHLEPWNTQSYARAWKRVVPVAAEDGSERLVPVAKWLGDLCDEWGLAKGDWDFE
ncbi:hypothetical protein BJX66DRAFT_57918 [Aspergillus keveii]|uniref:Fungal STAND N-terminal Goodbye domain-containing protein n=1 Tax=Aspergillus keveii TaxID=714993 RepID=A0ABR4FR95_9EURO